MCLWGEGEGVGGRGGEGGRAVSFARRQRSQKVMLQHTKEAQRVKGGN